MLIKKEKESVLTYTKNFLLDNLKFHVFDFHTNQNKINLSNDDVVQMISKQEQNRKQRNNRGEINLKRCASVYSSLRLIKIISQVFCKCVSP